MPRAVQIAVVGGGNCGPELAAVAREVGAEIARAGATLICGGLGGVMAAAAEGARGAGGLTVGILPSYNAADAAPGIAVAIPTGMGHARNVLVVSSADVVIALDGSVGTASEVAFARVLGRPVIGLRAWFDQEGVVPAHSPQEAVRLALRYAAT